ncbi:YraN family protein [Leptolyngbya sp. BL0902]|uniref:YraN family protein n=1 Tax=Leptolyngbya sp. BL0902 TaxID=1115757 RepID=UPI0018E7E171|nr:YraN family protein [Leptolyngbya sp. BL0902]QQE64603.1 YraN family protein [Leptolyngbya sp. BL0902]
MTDACPDSPAGRDALTPAALGTLGEDLIAQWMTARGWTVRDRQWHCTYGELDLVLTQGSPQEDGIMAFVEVKTRSQGNWDADGLMAITRSKQTKLWKAAQVYLLKHPQWANAVCRFDVALVACRASLPTATRPDRYLALSDGRYLILQDYIDCAFDARR